MTTRTPRQNKTREASARKRTWVPPNMLPDPEKDDDYRYRWVRTEFMGKSDMNNVSRRLREGWTPVKATDHPELMLPQDKRQQGDGVEVGGLMLCKMPEEMAQDREGYYAELAQQQLEGVDQNLFRESDPRMPISAPDRRSHTTFGSGIKP